MRSMLIGSVMTLLFRMTDRVLVVIWKVVNLNSAHSHDISQKLSNCANKNANNLASNHIRLITIQ